MWLSSNRLIRDIACLIHKGPSCSELFLRLDVSMSPYMLTLWQIFPICRLLLTKKLFDPTILKLLTKCFIYISNRIKRLFAYNYPDFDCHLPLRDLDLHYNRIRNISNKIETWKLGRVWQYKHRILNTSTPQLALLLRTWFLLCNLIFSLLLKSGKFWRPLISFSSYLDPDEAPQNVDPNLIQYWF